jgi:hypothetical protein
VTNLQRYTMRLVYRMRELSVIKTELGRPRPGAEPRSPQPADHRLMAGVACNIYAEIEQDRLANSFRRLLPWPPDHLAH